MEHYYRQLSEISLDVGYLISLLDEWIAGLEEDELRHQCRKSGNDFFEFLSDRGVESRVVAGIIQKLTGVNPSAAWKVEDLTQVAEFLFNYESTQICIRDDERKNSMSFRQRRSNAIRKIEERWKR